MISPAFDDDQQTRPLDLTVWWRILRHARPFRAHAVGLATMCVLIATCDILLPLYTGKIVDDVTTGQGAKLWWYGAYYILAAVGLCLGITGFILFAGRIATGVNHNIRRACFARLQQLSFSYFDQQSVGWLMSRLTSDSERLARIIGWSILDLLWGTCTVLGVAVVMLWLNWRRS